MVLRLFTPPGEGQHKLVPKRPDPIGANATLQYTVLGSTALAAAYTTFASAYARRVHPTTPVSRGALFIRSSARFGLWAGLLGATVNYYYYTSFASVVIRDTNPSVKPFRLYKWTKRRTVDDAALAGTAAGLLLSVPTLFLRRPAFPRWTRCVGLANVGASVGILGAHGYFEYTGERRKAYKRLDRRLKRRSLEFWAIFWNKTLMAQFDPLIQQYIRHNGLWYSSNLPESVFDEPDAYGRQTPKGKRSANVEAAAEEQAYYSQPFDYAEDLRQIDVNYTLAKMEELKLERQALLEEAEYLLYYNAQKEHEYCHIKDMDQDERQRRLQEIHLCEIAYNRVRTAATTIDIKLAKWELSLQHKALWDVTPTPTNSLESWFPKKSSIDYQKHDPTLSMKEIEKFQTQISAEVQRFEQLIGNHGYTKEKRERWKQDLEDGRVLLKAADYLIHDFEKRQKVLKERRTLATSATEVVAQEKISKGSITDAVQDKVKTEVEKKEEKVDKQTSEQTQMDESKGTKPPKDGCEPGSP